MATIATPQPATPTDIREIRSVPGALRWLAQTSQVHRYIATLHDYRAGATVARAIEVTTRRAQAQGLTTGAHLIDHLNSTATQLRTRASLCARFGEHDVARGLNLAANDIAGAASALRAYPDATS